MTDDDPLDGPDDALDDPPADPLDAQLAEAARSARRSIAIAESLTGGLLSSRLAGLPGAGEWYLGAVVAYASSVKHDVLGVPDVPVVSEAAAEALADGVAGLLHADVSLTVTGVGGPGPQDGVAAGTVWIGLRDHEGTRARGFRFGGEPADVLRQTCDAAIGWLAERLSVRT